MSEKNQKIKEESQKDPLESNLLFYNLLNLDKPRNFAMIVLLRVLMEIFWTQCVVHPDELLQGNQMAYGLVYGGVRLPWEWQDAFRMRNIIYPAYLSIPLWILKFLRLDYTTLVIYSSYIFHAILVCTGDYYFYQVCKKALGVQSARVAFIIYFTSHFFTLIYIRTFTNSVEAVAHLVAMNYFQNVSHKFDSNLKILTATLTLVFGIRNTSVIGWVPLLFVKMIEKQAVIAFLKTFLFVFIPTILFVILCDSLYYGSFTFTAFNFLKFNIFENLSDNFGISSKYEYLNHYMPYALNEMMKILIPALLYHLFDCIRYRKIPYLLIFAGMNLLVVSLIPHKEMRFMVPFLPFVFMIAGQFGAMLIKIRVIGKLFGLYLIFYAIMNLNQLHINHTQSMKQTTAVLQHIIDNDPNPHSVSIEYQYEFPAYTYFHRHPSQTPTKLHVAELFHFQKELSEPIEKRNLQLASIKCFEIVYKMMTESKPKYILNSKQNCRRLQYCNRACTDAVSEYYDINEVYETEVLKLKDEYLTADQR